MRFILLFLFLPQLFSKPIINGVKQIELFETDEIVVVCVLTNNVCCYSDYDRIEKELKEYYSNNYKKDIIVSFDFDIYAKVKAYNQGVAQCSKEQLLTIILNRRNRRESLKYEYS